MTTRVLVTGAGGFIGHYICQRLVESGYLVRALTRQPTPSLAALGAQTEVVGDINAISDWRSLLQDVNRIVHLAGRAGRRPGRGLQQADDYFRDNVQATKSLVAGAIEAGVRQLIFISTIKVFGDGPFSAPLKSTDEPRPSDDYGRSKLCAERWILAACAASTTEPVIVRPPLVYGPMVKGNFRALMGLVSGGRPLPVGNALGLRSFVSVWNLGDLVIRLIEGCGYTSGIWHVSDDEDCSTRHLIEEMAHSMGAPIHVFGLPAWLMKGSLALLGKRSVYGQIFESLEVDVSKTKLALGWQPPVTLSDGLARTVAWFRQEVKAAR